MTPERIAELRALCAAATEGPWDYDVSKWVIRRKSDGWYYVNATKWTQKQRCATKYSYCQLMTIGPGERRVRLVPKRKQSPAYNHTREDSPLMPCPKCATTPAERELAEALLAARNLDATTLRVLAVLDPVPCTCADRFAKKAEEFAKQFNDPRPLLLLARYIRAEARKP